MIKTLTKLMNDPEFQEECVECKKTVFYQNIDDYGWCMGCRMNRKNPLLEPVEKPALRKKTGKKCR